MLGDVKSSLRLRKKPVSQTVQWNSTLLWGKKQQFFDLHVFCVFSSWQLFLLFEAACMVINFKPDVFICLRQTSPLKVAHTGTSDKATGHGMCWTLGINHNSLSAEPQVFWWLFTQQLFQVCFITPLIPLDPEHFDPFAFLSRSDKLFKENCL